jgi:hypothetical protein
MSDVREEHMDPTGGLLLKAGLTLMTRTAPTGVVWVKSWFKGRRILIVGQARAGKSTFVDYLEFGVFDKEKTTAKTADVVPTARFNVSIGRDQALVMYVKKAEDTPGQVGAVHLANLAFDRRPHALVIFLDLTTPLSGEVDRSGGEWLKEFCKRLDRLWIGKRGRKNPIMNITVVLSKEDKVAQPTVDAYLADCKATLEAELRESRGGMQGEIAIIPAVLVKTATHQTTESLDRVLTNLAKGLK